MVENQQVGGLAVTDALARRGDDITAGEIGAVRIVWDRDRVTVADVADVFAVDDDDRILNRPRSFLDRDAGADEDFIRAALRLATGERQQTQADERA